jgi:hypothetical protein
MYSFDPISSGFNKDVQTAHVRKTKANTTVNINGTTVPTSGFTSVSDGWYYIRNVHSNTYLQATKDKVELVSMTAEENPAMRFYISTENDITTIKAQENYSDITAEYLMMNNSKDCLLTCSDSLEKSKLNAYHKFILREPTVGDFNIITTADGGTKPLRVNDRNKLIFDNTVTDN